MIKITTDKDLYKPGEVVNITIWNIGTQPIHFSSTDSDIKISNLKTGEVFVPSEILLSSLIPSGSFKTILWNQLDYQGLQVMIGNYSANVSLGPLHGNSTFVISS